jgi:thymidine phosphorylase
MTGPVSERTLSLYHRILHEPRNVGLVAELTEALANSGHRRPVQLMSADVASTGGPSSLSTLLCPLILVADGFAVPKIGVEGRPAGGIDVLGTIPNYRISLSPEEFDASVQSAMYAHVEAGRTWVPEDAALFALRQSSGTQAVPALVTASILAKKRAAGVLNAGLDVRIAEYGNFGRNMGEALTNAELFCEVSDQLDIQSIAALTDASVPYQPYIGRGEALLALSQAISGRMDNPWLTEHVAMCIRIAHQIRSIQPKASDLAKDPLFITRLRNAHISNLVAQGASDADFQHRVESIATQPRQTVLSKAEGYIHYNLQRIRNSIAKMNRETASKKTQEPYPDQVGVQLMSPPNHWVRPGDPVLQVRAKVALEATDIGSWFECYSTPSAPANSILEVVRT